MTKTIVRGLLPALLVLIGPLVGIATAQEELRTVTQGLAGPDDDDYYWKIKEIPICFDTSNAAPANLTRYRQRIMDDLNDTWAGVTALSFRDTGACRSGWTGVNINFASGSAGNAQGLGTNKTNKIVVTLPTTYSRYTMVHEFGHVLGFSHGSKRPDSPSWCVTDRGGATPHWLKRTQTTWDPNSIMNYCANTSDLSFGDVIGAQQVYGKPSGWALGLNEDGDSFGDVLATGDINGDSHPDLVVGTAREDIRSARDSGAAFVYFGNASGALLPRQSLNQSAYGSDEAGDTYGAQVVLADFDGDGRDDIAIAAPSEDIASHGRPNSGLIALYRWTGTEIAFWQTLTLEGYTSLGGRLAAGDLDGDGRAELLASAYHVNDNAGEVLLIRFDRQGKPTVNGGARYQLRDHLTFATDAREHLFSQMIVADIRGNARSELIVGHAEASAEAAMGARIGFVDVFTMQDGRLNRVARLTDTPQVPGGRFGMALAAGDFDGDGLPQLAVGVATPNGAGRVAVFEKNASGNPTLVDMQSQSTLGLGGFEAGDRFAQTLAAGDFNGDGLSDLAISVPGEAVGRDTTQNGLVNVALGSPTGLVGGYPLAQTPVGYDEDGDRHGAALVSSDLDGDGRAELISGVPGEAPGAEPKAGMVLVYRTPRPALNAWYAITQEGGGVAKD